MKLYDAHNHLHDARLAPHHPAIFAELEKIGLAGVVVNGTREADWAAVAALTREHPTLLTPSFGLHPWFVGERTPDWLSSLRAQFLAHPTAGVGEIGLDRWIEDHDDDLQAKVFQAQLELATELARPVTIHCLRAWGRLDEILHQSEPLPRGFLIHAYGGPAEMVPGFAKLGGYFSFNAYFLHERKGKQRDVFRQIPTDRLLVETDAPDMAPPEEPNRHPLPQADGKSVNHPANLALAYEALAEIRGVSLKELAAQVSENFDRLFSSKP